MKQSEAGGDRKSERYLNEHNSQDCEKSLSSKPSKLNNDPIDVQKVLANEAGVSVGTFQNYQVVRENADPELLEQVKQGEVKIGTAYRMLASDTVKKFNEIAKTYTFIGEHIPFKDNDEVNREMYTRLKAMRQQLEDTLTEMTNEWEQKIS
jgi:hypothetical protein